MIFFQICQEKSEKSACTLAHFSFFAQNHAVSYKITLIFTHFSAYGTPLHWASPVQHQKKVAAYIRGNLF
jgi:hypothetical protein